MLKLNLLTDNVEAQPKMYPHVLRLLVFGSKWQESEHQ